MGRNLRRTGKEIYCLVVDNCFGCIGQEAAVYVDQHGAAERVGFCDNFAAPNLLGADAAEVDGEPASWLPLPDLCLVRLHPADAGLSTAWQDLNRISIGKLAVTQRTRHNGTKAAQTENPIDWQPWACPIALRGQLM
jgi:hypothetical protein